MDMKVGLKQFFLERIRRMLVASAGLLVFAFGYYMQLRICIGGTPWHTLNEGISQTFGITFGQASIFVSVLVIVSDLLLKEPIGLGTILDAILVGWGADFFLWLDPIPYQNSLIGSLLVLFTSMVIVCVSQVIYMKAELSCGPRDALMVALGKRVRKIPIGAVNIAMNVAVLLIGYCMGGTVGLGTLINMVATGVVLETVFRLCKFEARDVVHEGLAETVHAFLSAKSK